MKLDYKNKALQLRKDGYSVKEISKILSVAKSSVSIWVRDVHLSEEAKKRIMANMIKGRYLAAEKKRSQKNETIMRLREEAKAELKGIELIGGAEKLLCALLYWCEGVKNDSYVAFANSDPKLTKLFIDLLCKYFKVDRKKFRAVLHLHQYHNPKIQEKFWSRSLNLSSSQFRKYYLKPNTGIRYRDNYPGCISVRYYDTLLARKLLYLAQIYMGA